MRKSLLITLTSAVTAAQVGAALWLVGWQATLLLAAAAIISDGARYLLKRWPR